MADCRLISVPKRIIPFLGELELLDDYALEELKETLEYLQSASSERRRAILEGRS